MRFVYSMNMPEAPRFKPGACENCGATGHKRKDCLDRPRAVGAKYTGKTSATDAPLPEEEASYEAKRDRWKSFEPEMFDAVVEDFQARKGGDEKLADFTGVEKKEAVTDAKASVMTSRNLRIREDTAKYLVDLDADAGLYNPKSRSMVEVGGLEFVKSGSEVMQVRAFAWEAYKQGGGNLHEVAQPTQVEKLFRMKQSEEERLKDNKRRKLADAYGPSDDQILPSSLRITDGHEASHDMHASLTRSHAAVWGSWFDRGSGKWGYACCKRTERSSKCLVNS